MTLRELEEYRALRETIREHGAARVWIFLAGLVAWGALTIATAALAALPIATLLPLLVLAAAFEAVLGLHLGVAQMRRYLQVFFEEDAGWEHRAMAAGRPVLGSSTDALFTGFFVAATILNFVPVIIAEPVQAEVAVVGTAHLLVIMRILIGRRAAGRQRLADLQRFEQLRKSP